MVTAAPGSDEMSATGNGPSSPVLKFLVGTTAGACATLLPRLVPALSAQNPDLRFLTVEYGVACAIFSVLVGLGTLFWEWNLPKKPAQTFLTALGLPALIAGTFNTKTTADQLQHQLQQTQSLQQALGREAGIPTLAPPGPNALVPQSPLSHGFASGFLARPAHASVATERKTTSHAGGMVLAQLEIQVDQPGFVIVLDRAATAVDAQQKAQALRQTLPGAKVARAGSEFLVIDSDQPRPKPQATMDAVDLKNVHHLSPALVEWKGLQLIQ